MYCRNCGKVLASTSAQCVQCGVPVGLGRHYCPDCGVAVEESAKICSRCGYPLVRMAAEQPQPEASAPPPYTQQAYNPPPSYGESSYTQETYSQPNYTQPNYTQAPPSAQPAVQSSSTVSTPFPQHRSRLAAGLLGILLGSLGIHNFYLGNTRRGLLQLLLTVLAGGMTGGMIGVGMGIWGLIEGVQILSGVINRDGNGKKLI